VIAITGACTGIGAALTESLARKGARFALAARAAAEAQAITADVTLCSEVEALAAEWLAHFGRIDVWVNHAGRGIARSLLELSEQNLDELMSVDVEWALAGTQVAAPIFGRRGAGYAAEALAEAERKPPFFQP
jgi:NAD(P)-dependent dehydrogenase (short-subunit alcohol dehydrogenase family)